MGCSKTLLFQVFEGQAGFLRRELLQVLSDRLGYYINFYVYLRSYFGLSEGSFFKRLRDDCYGETIGIQFGYCQ